MTLVEEIRNQLSKVFTPNGDVKVCGRDECRKAIQIASEICPGVDFGNPETGIMNLQTFHDCFFCDKELKKQLFKVFDTQGTLLPINHAESWFSWLSISIRVITLEGKRLVVSALTHFTNCSLHTEAKKLLFLPDILRIWLLSSMCWHLTFSPKRALFIE